MDLVLDLIHQGIAGKKHVTWWVLLGENNGRSGSFALDGTESMEELADLFKSEKPDSIVSYVVRFHDGGSRDNGVSSVSFAIRNDELYRQDLHTSSGLLEELIDVATDVATKGSDYEHDYPLDDDDEGIEADESMSLPGTSPPILEPEQTHVKHHVRVKCHFCETVDPDKDQYCLHHGRNFHVNRTGYGFGAGKCDRCGGETTFPLCPPSFCFDVASDITTDDANVFPSPMFSRVRISYGLPPHQWDLILCFQCIAKNWQSGYHQHLLTMKQYKMISDLNWHRGKYTYENRELTWIQNGDDFYWSAFHGRLEELVQLIRDGKDPLYMHDLPLRWSETNGHLETSVLLILHGAKDFSWAKAESCTHKSGEPCTHMLEKYTPEIICELALNYIVANEKYSRLTRRHTFHAVCQYVVAHKMIDFSSRLKYHLLRHPCLRDEPWDALIPEVYFSADDARRFSELLASGIVDGVNREFNVPSHASFITPATTIIAESSSLQDVSKLETTEATVSLDAKTSTTPPSDASDMSNQFRGGGKPIDVLNSDNIIERLQILKYNLSAVDKLWDLTFSERPVLSRFSKAGLISQKDLVTKEILQFVRDIDLSKDILPTSVTSSMANDQKKLVTVGTQTDSDSDVSIDNEKECGSIPMTSPTVSIKKHVALPLQYESARFAEIHELVFTFEKGADAMLQWIRTCCVDTWLYDVNINVLCIEDKEAAFDLVDDMYAHYKKGTLGFTLMTLCVYVVPTFTYHQRLWRGTEIWWQRDEKPATITKTSENREDPNLNFKDRTSQVIEIVPIDNKKVTTMEPQNSTSVYQDADYCSRQIKLWENMSDSSAHDIALEWWKMHLSKCSPSSGGIQDPSSFIPEKGTRPNASDKEQSDKVAKQQVIAKILARECMICLDPIVPNSLKRWQRANTNCNHDFHISCLEEWVSVTEPQQCPMCDPQMTTRFSALPPAEVQEQDDAHLHSPLLAQRTSPPGFTLRTVPPDGDCFYHAFIDGLIRVGKREGVELPKIDKEGFPPSIGGLRGLVADEIMNNKDLYEDIVDEWKSHGISDPAMTPQLAAARTLFKEWATNTVIHILAVRYSIRIDVHQQIEETWHKQSFPYEWKKHVAENLCGKIDVVSYPALGHFDALIANAQGKNEEVAKETRVAAKASNRDNPVWVEVASVPKQKRKKSKKRAGESFNSTKDKWDPWGDD